MNDTTTQFGFVAIVGQPNVGKSTLMNRLLGKKLSITSRKPQTTRHRILGVKTQGDVQLAYVDTPGLHRNEKSQMNKYMNRVVRESLSDVDVIVFMVEGTHWNDQDTMVLKLLKDINRPVILAINKVDKIKHREYLLPHMEQLNEQYPFHKIIPISAKDGTQVEALEQEIMTVLPKDSHYYSPEQFTDRSDRFFASEIIREKLMRQLGQEIPYSIAVMIEALVEEEDMVRISATIMVAKDSHKSIVIGKKGARLKEVGISARADLEKFFEKKVYVQLWVKVKSGWADDAKMLGQLGYDE